MTENEIKCCIEEYKKIKEENELLKEKMPILKKYFKISSLSEEEMINLAFKNNSYDTKESNNLFVYMGEGFWREGDTLYYEYKDLENEKNTYCFPENREQFENKNYIIDMNVVFDSNSKMLPKEIYNSKFKKLQLQFFKYLLELPQKQAVNQILEKYKVKVKEK